MQSFHRLSIEPDLLCDFRHSLERSKLLEVVVLLMNLFSVINASETKVDVLAAETLEARAANALNA